MIKGVKIIEISDSFSFLTEIKNLIFTNEIYIYKIFYLLINRLGANNIIVIVVLKKNY